MVCWVSLAGAAVVGTVSVGVAPNAPESTTPAAVVVDGAGSDFGPDLASVPHAASIAAGTISNAARRREPRNTDTPFGWDCRSKNPSLAPRNLANPGALSRTGSSYAGFANTCAYAHVLASGMWR